VDSTLIVDSFKAKKIIFLIGDRAIFEDDPDAIQHGDNIY
jgi:hypothetical protein